MCAPRAACARIDTPARTAQLLKARNTFAESDNCSGMMAGFIECKGVNGEFIEVDIEEDRTVSLETLKSLFGPEVSALTYTNPLSGRERVVRVADSKLLEPKDGWEALDRVYSISFGFQHPLDSTTPKPVQDSTTSAEYDASITSNKMTPFTRKLLAHPLIKKEKDAMVDDVIDIDIEGMITAAVNFIILCAQILQSQNLASK